MRAGVLFVLAMPALSSFYARLGGAVKGGHRQFVCRDAPLVRAVLHKLKALHYVMDYVAVPSPVPHRPASWTVFLPFDEVRGVSLVQDVTVVSRPGRRLYAKAATLYRYARYGSAVLLSTSVGVLTDAEARRRGLGGHVLFRIT